MTSQGNPHLNMSQQLKSIRTIVRHAYQRPDIIVSKKMPLPTANGTVCWINSRGLNSSWFIFARGDGALSWREWLCCRDLGVHETVRQLMCGMLAGSRPSKFLPLPLPPLPLSTRALTSLTTSALVSKQKGLRFQFTGSPCRVSENQGTLPTVLGWQESLWKRKESGD